MKRSLVCVFAALVLLPGISEAWWGGGHDLRTLANVL
jgi:hypothetical protein